jgi:hypothetical protein
MIILWVQIKKPTGFLKEKINMTIINNCKNKNHLPIKNQKEKVKRKKNQSISIEALSFRKVIYNKLGSRSSLE